MSEIPNTMPKATEISAFMNDGEIRIGVQDVVRTWTLVPTF